MEPLEAALRRLVLDGELVAEGDCVYRAELWETEQRLGAALGERARAADAELFEPPRRPEGSTSPTSSGASSSSSAPGRSCS